MAAPTPPKKAAHLRSGARLRRGFAASLAGKARRLLLPGAGLLSLCLIGPLEAQTGRSFADPNAMGSPLDRGGTAATPLQTRAAASPPTPAAGAAARSAAPGASNNPPVTFTADEVEYDRERGIVTARGRVEAWQNERILRADTFIYDRQSGIATVRGNVQLMEADGQVLFAEEAELGEGFREGVLTGVRALLAANARLVANGARRTPVPVPEGAPPGTQPATFTDLTRVVYSSCNLCESDPSRPPLWQVRARTATQDTEVQRVAYRDARVEFYGVPLLYAPFFSHPDPQSPRASGLIFPTSGSTRFLGAFTQIPYFWAIDAQSDLTLTTTLATRQSPNLSADYRRRFNNGDIQIQSSVGYFNGNDNNGQKGLAGHIFSRARFHLDENWRTGLEVNRATSDTYLRTYKFEYRRVLTSMAYLEGFWGTEGYARFDARVYQGLRTSDTNRTLPIVGPNAYGEYAPRDKVFGGFLQVDTGLLAITREVGAYDQRLATRVGWRREEVDPVGGLWNFRMQGDARAYNAGRQQLNPNYFSDANGQTAVGNFRAAADWRMPLVRDWGEWGQQTIEPRVQVVGGPNTGYQGRYPNEDSIDYEFTDATLFNLNRFNGRDRQEGGMRVDYALRQAWNFPNGGMIEAVAGQSLRLHRDSTFAAGSGLENRSSDYVGRLTVAPTNWLNVSTRARLDSRTGQNNFNDFIASTSFRNVLGLDSLGLQAGYLYSPPLPYITPVRTRNEVLAGFTASTRTDSGSNWRVGVSARYDLDLDRPVLIQGVAGYEDECFILETSFVRRFARDATTSQQYAGNTLVLIRLAFKTLGQYGFRAL